MTGHRAASSAPMRTDDVVAPGVRRFRTAWIWVAGIVLILAGVIVVALVLDERSATAQREAALSSDEVRQLQDFLDQRGAQRDAERAQVQAQLDEQRAALCGAIATLAAAADDATLAVLTQASTDLDCASLPPPAAPAPSSTSAPTAPGTGPGTAAPRATSTTAPDGPGAPSPAPGTSAPAPAPDPAPDPGTDPGDPDDPPADDDGGLLDPITEPVCDLLGPLCLGG